MTDDSAVPPHKPPVPGTDEPDDEGFSTNPYPPPRKPKHQSLERDAEDNLADRIKDTTTSTTSLKVDHPYGDGKHHESPSATLARLGAGEEYGD